MDNITLILKPYHMPALREAVRARNMIVQTDTTSSENDRAVCADLEMRVNLLAAAVAAEISAKENRKRYNQYIWSAPQLNSRRSRKEAAKQAQEPPRGNGQGNDAPTDEKPQGRPQKPPQSTTEILPGLPFVDFEKPTASIARLQKRSV